MCACRAPTGGVTIPPIKAVWDWIVGFATDAGQYVKEKATTFAEALKRAWLAFFQNHSDIVPDANNPLKGTFSGILKCVVAWGKDGVNELKITLKQPRMQRTSSDSDHWELDDAAKKQIETLRDQLLKED